MKFFRKGKSLEFSQAFEIGLNYWQMLITYLCKGMNQQFCGKNVPANLAKVFLKVINIYYRELPAVASDFGHKDENYKNYIFCCLQIYQHK